ncbi:MAG TPA: LuxR C-terminal-related transcriptional regulator [Solirubrobacterales bacterium]|nr:LuxR C-terminal-related transcriptional regulator [Solirubrobacterales bacterium]
MSRELEGGGDSPVLAPQGPDGVDVLRAAVGGAQAGRGRTLLVSGPAGIGKTHLLKAAADIARPRLVRLVARGTELEREMPFGAPLQLLEASVRRSPELLSGTAGMSRRLFFLDVGDGAFSEVEGQHLLIHSLYRLVADLAARQPLALLVDDAHELDAPSLRFLAYLARRVRDLPVVLVVALRPSHPGAETHLLGELIQTPGAQRIEPRPLREEEVTKMVAAALDCPLHPAFARECFSVTGGNPLLVRELARGLAEHGAVGSDRDLELLRRIGPEPVAWAVQGTLRRLPEPATAIAGAVSVFETHGTIELTAALAGVAADSARDAISALQLAGLVEGEIELRFAHPLIGQAVRASIPSAERASLHAGAAELLAERGDPIAVAAHLLLSPATGQPWAVQALVRAADQARAGASPERAVELLERALQETPRPEQRPLVLAELARAQAAIGDAAGVETFSEAIAVTDADEDRAWLLLGLTRAYQDQARFAEAAETAALGLGIDPRDDQLRTELTAAHDTAIIWTSGGGEEAGEIELMPGMKDLIAEARERLFTGRDHEVAADLARQAWAGAAKLPGGGADDPTAIRLFALLHNADAEREAIEMADRCLAAARRSGSRMDIATWQHMRGHALAYAGRLEEAEAELRAAFEMRGRGWSTWLPITASALIYVLIERDDLDGADAVLAAADDFVLHPRESPMWAMTDAAHGRLVLARGEPARALEILEETGRRMAAELGISNPACSPWRSDCVVALAALGRAEEAIALADEDLERAEAWGAPRALGGALRVRGLLASPDERLGWMSRAVGVLEDSETRLDHAHALLALGRAQSEAGTGESDETLRVALDLAEQCGGQALARRALAELHAAGSRPRRPRLKGPQSLTEREADIAELAASGMTNNEIAERLVLAPRTVAFHLGNAYRKLGIPGRSELTAALDFRPD